MHSGNHGNLQQTNVPDYQTVHNDFVELPRSGTKDADVDWASPSVSTKPSTSRHRHPSSRTTRPAADDVPSHQTIPTAHVTPTTPVEPKHHSRDSLHKRTSHVSSPEPDLGKHRGKVVADIPENKHSKENNDKRVIDFDETCKDFKMPNLEHTMNMTSHFTVLPAEQTFNKSRFEQPADLSNHLPPNTGPNQSKHSSYANQAVSYHANHQQQPMPAAFPQQQRLYDPSSYAFPSANTSARTSYLSLPNALGDRSPPTQKQLRRTFPTAPPITLAPGGLQLSPESNVPPVHPAGGFSQHGLSQENMAGVPGFKVYSGQSSPQYPSSNNGLNNDPGGGTLWSRSRTLSSRRRTTSSTICGPVAAPVPLSAFTQRPQQQYTVQTLAFIIIMFMFTSWDSSERDQSCGKHQYAFASDTRHWDKGRDLKPDLGRLEARHSSVEVLKHTFRMNDLLIQNDFEYFRQKQQLAQFQRQSREQDIRLRTTLRRTPGEEDAFNLKLQEYEYENASLKAQLAEATAAKDAEIEALNKKLGETEYEMQQLQEAVKQSSQEERHEVTRLQNKLKDRDKMVGDLKKKMKHAMEKYDKYKKRVESLERYLGDLPTQEEAKKRADQISFCSRVFTSKEEVSQLRERVVDLEDKLSLTRKDNKQSTCMEKEILWNGITDLASPIPSQDAAVDSLEQKEQELVSIVASLQKELARWRDRGKQEERDAASQEDMEELKFENDRLREDCDRAKKLLESKHKKMKALQLQHQTDQERLEERVAQEEGVVTALREEIRGKDEATRKLRDSMKELASQNQDLLEQTLTLQEQLQDTSIILFMSDCCPIFQLASQNQDLLEQTLTLQEQLQELQRLNSAENTKLSQRLYRELGVCQSELQALVQVLMQRAEGKEPNMSILLGLKEPSTPPDDDQQGQNGHNLKTKLAQIRELRKEVDHLRSLISNKYAEDMGDNCIMQGSGSEFLLRPYPCPITWHLLLYDPRNINIHELALFGMTPFLTWAAKGRHPPRRRLRRRPVTSPLTRWGGRAGQSHRVNTFPVLGGIRAQPPAHASAPPTPAAACIAKVLFPRRRHATRDRGCALIPTWQLPDATFLGPFATFASLQTSPNLGTMILHQVLLYLVHTFSAIRTWLASLYHGLKKPLSFKHRKRNVHRIKSDSKALSKLPMHVGLVVVEEDFRYGDLASLVVWCAAMGISYISLYDSQGILKRNNTSLWQEIMKQQQELLGEESNKYNIELVRGNRTATQLT
ncbi:regulation of mitotic centrosome separation, partial [Branchiostoma belcheri]